jgi:hypothetical protein
MIMYNGQAILTWNPNSDPDIAGNKVYTGLSTGDYDAHFDVGNVLTATLNGFVHGETRFFSVTAYDFTGNESTFSAEVAKPIIVTVLNVMRTVK